MTKSTWTGTVTGSVSYGYDNDLRLASENGVAFTYDPDSLLIGAGALSLERDGRNGVLVGTTLGGISDRYTYNEFGEVMSYTATYEGTPLLSLSYARDNGGRITAIGPQGYEYDLAGRLTRVTNSGAAIAEYTYDENGNRKTHLDAGGSNTGTYDAEDRLLQYGATTFTYTASGELKTKTVGGATTTYDYDALGNLRSVVLAGGTRIDYVIDGQNRRIGRKVNGTLVQGWLYGDQLRIVAQLDGANNVVSRFVYGSRTNVPDYLITGGITYRILSDHLGSPRMVVNVADGTVAETRTYDEFGRVLTDSNPGFIPFGFAGGLHDELTGLVRFGARDYDPHTGRWTAKDPALFGGGDTNLYGYVFNDPVNLYDPTGISARGAASSIGNLFRWATGTLPPISAADPESAADLSRTPVADQIRQQFVQNGCRNGTYWGDFQYGELTGTWNVTGQTVGSFGAKVRNIGNGQIVVTAFNTWGLESATRFPGRTNRKNASVEDMLFGGAPLQYPKSMLNNRTGGPMGTATVNYIWMEQSPCGCTP